MQNRECNHCKLLYFVCFVSNLRKDCRAKANEKRKNLSFFFPFREEGQKLRERRWGIFAIFSHLKSVLHNLKASLFNFFTTQSFALLSLQNKKVSLFPLCKTQKLNASLSAQHKSFTLSLFSL